ncbi:uncharacterized protein N7498_006291 [Penicillium cinerascens]|uniref:F-box domain-containing protein n=1 Tax=Penicillium cinerascens TaxID=70096 RepID=A0A9W9MHY5_9EURO|nr:uncharacterized protein N7498_006291 [Penicillium cinerascens]KAJ5201628.1 hypothetical protein N7498_006291 [Penicillium cinerascens]
MDLEVQGILDRFRTLPNSSRRDVYHGILDQLRRDEWRGVKERADQTSFECDILGNLPIEIAVLVTTHMNLADLLILQRVSRRWQEVLSSPIVQWAAVRAATGQDSAAQNFDRSSPAKLLKKRLRMERGQPTSTFKLRSPFSIEYDVLMLSGGVGYFKNIYAWLDGRDGRTSVCILNLRSGKMDRVTTENRELLSELNISEKLVAVISRQGYCHVWDIETLEHKAFRLASLAYHHFLISGTKVLLAFLNYVVHWSFDSGIARTTNVGPDVALLALDPLEDQFTVASLCKIHEDLLPNFSIIGGRADQLQLRIEKYAIGSVDNFNSVLKKYQKLPFENDYEWIKPASYSQHIDHGQSSTLWERYFFSLLERSFLSSSESAVATGFPDEDPGLFRDTLLTGLNPVGSIVYFTLDTTRDQVDVHIVADVPKTSDIAFLDQNLIYTPGRNKKLQILGPRISTATSHGIRYDHTVQRSLPNVPCEWIYGDKEFVVLVNMEDVEIWNFDEDWKPAEIYQT